MVVTPDAERSRPRFPVEKACVILAAVLYFFVAFVAVVHSQGGGEPNYVLPAVIGAFPICAFLAFRYPMIFPFGLYVALVPFDSLLQVSGGGATIGRLVAIGTAAAMILHALLLRRAFVPHRAWFFWGAVVLYMGASLLWTGDSANGILVTLTVIQLFLFMTILAMYPATKVEFTIGLSFVIGCGLLAAGYAIQQYLSGNVSSDRSARVDLSSGGYAIDFNYFAEASSSRSRSRCAIRSMPRTRSQRSQAASRRSS